jgi:mannose-6-phosphate isomerase-like protein (cupin superfamily)
MHLSRRNSRPRRSRAVTLHATAVCLLGILLAMAAHAAGIPMEKLQLTNAPGISIKPLMVGEIAELKVDLVSITAPALHVELAKPNKAVVWMIVDGKGTMKTRNRHFEVEGETIARAPQGWDWRISAAPGTTLHLLRLERDITPGDFEELKKYPQFQAEPWVKKFLECEPYSEAIKSPKTISRTLLPENYVPRMALGTVETTGPDEVGKHSHPMLEQLFFGLRGNDIIVTADNDQANLTEFTILHIPLGSHHGAHVLDGKKLHYVWMDFFMKKEGQEWLKMHKPISETQK